MGVADQTVRPDPEPVWAKLVGFDTVLVYPQDAHRPNALTKVIGRRWSDPAVRFVFGRGHETDGRDPDIGPSQFVQASGLADAMLHFAANIQDDSLGREVDWPVFEINSATATIRRWSMRPETFERTTPVESQVPYTAKDHWRAAELDAIQFPPEMTRGEGLGYLGVPMVLGLDWSTSAPVGDKFWIDLDGQPIELIWSGHESSYEASRRSCYLEGLERVVGALGQKTQTVMAPAADLNWRYLEPDAFGRFPQAAYGDGLEDFDPTAPHEWVTAVSLRTRECVYVPVELVHYGRTVEHRWAYSTSSGWAVGSSPDEAAFFGLIELIERDAVIGAWYGGLQPLPVDLTTVGRLSGVLARAQLLGCRFHVSQVPSQTGLPVMVAVVESPEVYVFGSAAHPDPETALESAVNEAWTYLPERERLARRLRDEGRLPWTDPEAVMTINDHAALVFKPTVLSGLDRFIDHSDPRPLSQSAAWRPESLEEGGPLKALVSALDGIGLESYAVIAPSPLAERMSVHVVATLVPGLIPIDFGWNRQRAPQMARTRELAQLFTGDPSAGLWKEPHPLS
jgi:ribosomal protein S12 methylthiotransferase accessory factor